MFELRLMNKRFAYLYTCCYTIIPHPLVASQWIMRFHSARCCFANPFENAHMNGISHIIGNIHSFRNFQYPHKVHPWMGQLKPHSEFTNCYHFALIGRHQQHYHHHHRMCCRKSAKPLAICNYIVCYVFMCVLTTIYFRLFSFQRCSHPMILNSIRPPSVRIYNWMQSSIIRFERPFFCWGASSHTESELASSSVWM